jgi:hypothetical protein
MVYVRRSPGGSCSGVDGPWRCCGAEQTLGVVRLLCSDTLSVRMCRLGPAATRYTFWRLLRGEGNRLEGLMSGPGSPRPLKPVEEFVFLRHAPCVTLSEEWLTVPCPLGSAREPSSLGAQGAYLQLGPWLALKARRGPRIGLKLLMIGSLRLGRAPEPRVEAAGMLVLGPIFSRRVHASAPEGCSPRATLEGSVEGSRGQEPLIPRLNIPPC